MNHMILQKCMAMVGQRNWLQKL